MVSHRHQLRLNLRRSEKMYIPKYFKITDFDEIREFVHETHLG